MDKKRAQKMAREMFETMGYLQAQEQLRVEQSALTADKVMLEALLPMADEIKSCLQQADPQGVLAAAERARVLVAEMRLFHETAVAQLEFLRRLRFKNGEVLEVVSSGARRGTGT